MKVNGRSAQEPLPNLFPDAEQQGKQDDKEKSSTGKWQKTIEKIGAGEPVAKIAEDNDNSDYTDYSQSETLEAEKQNISQQIFLRFFLFLPATSFFSGRSECFCLGLRCWSFCLRLL